ncbi:TPA: hypothetical protein QDB15_001098 [Burkholderia vietnamiensis]|uniref:hypothetical protein n=1 Tax=Burkholderia vietnamiensis TaxID=60552 RepID=UPI001593F143|nr:hypothetical protein [Burkholderia vietnamiensis]MCA8210323.1 hypothetical protein [Burkholderia vietnamiensis]HDR9100064.1 hypothetical protein [Burkholderia vietnamiensis]HDR9117351.1 hypothetical protein [Burkholderia vietnamiensis]
MASILPNGKTQFVDQNGKPLAGGTVTFYAPGTTTKQDTWQDQAQTQVNRNPVVLDSRGQASIWGSGSYRQVVADKFGAVVWDQVVSEISAPLSGPGGAALVGFQQKGGGAVVRTMQDKQRDWLAPQDMGAAGDSATDDSAALNRVGSAGRDSYTPSASYKLNSTIQFGASMTYAAGRGAVHGSSSGLAGFRPASGSEISGGSYSNSGSAPVFDFPANVDSVAVRGASITSTGATNATGLNFNATGITNVMITSVSINTPGYGLLTNAGATVDGLVMTGFRITSQNADAVELNAPGVVHQNMAIVGGMLETLGTGGSHAAGFAAGLARARNVVLAGISVRQSRYEAFHFEDEQFGNVVCGVAAQNLNGDGVRIGQAASGIGEGVVVSGINARAATGATGTNGILMVWDSSGSVPGQIVNGSRFKGFSVGISGGKQDSMVNGNVIDTASTAAVYSAGGGWIHGRNLARNSPTLAKSVSGTVFDEIRSDGTPTTILDTSAHPANSIGSTLLGFSARGLSVTLPATAVTNANLFALPLLMNGHVIVRAFQNGGAAFIYLCADLVWDGTTLTVTNAMFKEIGAVAPSGAKFANNGGQLAAIFNNTGASSVTWTIDYLFRGDFYN